MGWTVRGSNPGEGEIFRTRPHRPWGLPSILYNGYRVSFAGVKRSGRGVDHLPSSNAMVKERVDLYVYFPSGSSWPVVGRPLPLPLRCTSGYKGFWVPNYFLNTCGKFYQGRTDFIMYNRLNRSTSLGECRLAKTWRYFCNNDAARQVRLKDWDRSTGIISQLVIAFSASPKCMISILNLASQIIIEISICQNWLVKCENKKCQNFKLNCHSSKCQNCKFKCDTS
jgi:hypothetical protein